MSTRPIILYVPGMNPKPAADMHRVYLWRVLLEGVRRADAEAVSVLAEACDFQMCAWNLAFYGQTRDLTPDIPFIEQALRNFTVDERDKFEARQWRWRANRLLYTLVDHMSWIIPWLMRNNRPLRHAVQETHRYFANDRQLADEARALVKRPLRECLREGRPVLLVGHSLGSVIAYDALWELSWVEQLRGKVDFLTVGSPLGMHYVQRQLLGRRQPGARRYPTLIGRWVNVAAVGDIIALDETFRDDYGYMLRHGMVEDIVDHVGNVYNTFREGTTLNVHRSYGYLLNPVVGDTIAQWWRRAQMQPPVGAAA